MALHMDAQRFVHSNKLIHILEHVGLYTQNLQVEYTGEIFKICFQTGQKGEERGSLVWFSLF